MFVDDINFEVEMTFRLRFKTKNTTIFIKNTSCITNLKIKHILIFIIYCAKNSFNLNKYPLADITFS